MPDIQNIPTRQYIGPRIIPHLWDPILWDASTQYDALAVVQYNGVPYIARYVPPQGTVPTNAEYWVRWADFNAQMAQLQQIVETYRDDIDQNATDIDTIEAIMPRSAFSSTNTVQKAINDEATARQQAVSAEAEARQRAINSTNDNVAANAADIADIAGRYQGGDIIIIGDSYDVPYSDDFTDGVSWSSRLQNTLASTNINVYISHVGGSGLANGVTPFYQQLSTLTDTLTEEQKDRVSTIIFYGGYNDKGATVGAINAGLQNFINICKTNYKNANRIIGAFVGRCVTGKTTGIHSAATFASVRQAFNNWLAASWTLPHTVAIVNGLNVLGSDDAFSSDYVHPSKEGLNRIASFMNGVVFGTPCAATYNTVDSTQIVSENGYTTSGKIYVQCKQYNPAGDEIRYFRLNSYISWSTPITQSFTGNTRMTFNLEPCSALMGINMIGSGTCLAHVDSKFFIVPMTWHIENTTLTVSIQILNDAGTNYLTGTLTDLTFITA